MPESVDTIIVGAGQAGLSVSSYLAKAGRDHLILERGEIAETWRSQRWESFTVNSPNWMNQLPGDDSPLDKPNDFWHLDELIESFTQWYDGHRCQPRLPPKYLRHSDRKWLIQRQKCGRSVGHHADAPYASHQ